MPTTSTFAAPTTTDRCDQCAGPLVAITLPAESGSLTMESCSHCDTRSWRRDGSPTNLNGALATVAAAKPTRRRSGGANTHRATG